MAKVIASLAPLACLALLCAGCARTSIVGSSRVDAGGFPPGRKVLVVSRVAWADEGWAVAFEKAIQTRFQDAGCPCVVQTRSPLALHTDKVRYAEQIARLNPDLVLVVEPGDGTADFEGRSLSRRFEAGLFKNYNSRQGRELVWRASFTVTPSGAFVQPSDMNALATDLAQRLDKDGFPSEPARKTGVEQAR
jgi:hypothetical protein